MSLISTKKKGVRKELRKLQTHKQKKTSQRSGHLSYNGKTFGHFEIITV